MCRITEQHTSSLGRVPLFWFQNFSVADLQVRDATRVSDCVFDNFWPIFQVPQEFLNSCFLNFGREESDFRPLDGTDLGSLIKSP